MSFDSKELARLFDAFLAIERNDPEGIEEQLNDYLFTHCDTIIARLEAADTLAEALRVGPMCDLCVRLYRASGGPPPMSRCAHSIKASESRTKEALAAYNKAKGA